VGLSKKLRKLYLAEKCTIDSIAGEINDERTLTILVELRRKNRAGSELGEKSFSVRVGKRRGAYERRLILGKSRSLRAPGGGLGQVKKA